RELDGNCSDVFFKAMKLCRARNWHDPRLLRKQPSECDLRRCCVLALSDLPEQIHQGLVRLACLRRKAWDSAANVGLVERPVLVNLSGQEAFAKGAEGDEADAEFFEGGND